MHVEQFVFFCPEHFCSPSYPGVFKWVRIARSVQLHVFTFSVPCCEVRYDFPALYGCMLLFVFIYVCWYRLKGAGGGEHLRKMWISNMGAIENEIGI